MTCELRECCKRPAAAFYSTPDAPRDTFRDGTPAPLLAVYDEPPPPGEDIAWHEAAHAIAHHVFGSRLERVTIAGQPHVKGDTLSLGLPDRMLMLLAGPAASDAHHRWSTTLFEHELAEYFARVDDIVMGNCDHCQAGLVATVAANKDRRDRVDLFREGERRAAAFIRLPAVRAAIRALAAALMAQRTLTGAQAHAIIEPFVNFGEFKNAEAH